MRVEINEYIIADDEICGGTPTFNGTRILVSQVLALQAAGISIKEILDDYFPQLTKEAIFAALNYASKNIENERYVAI